MGDTFWNLFTDTGDPVAYILYRAHREKERADERQADREAKRNYDSASC